MSFPAINTGLKNPMEVLETARDAAEAGQRAVGDLRDARIAAAQEVNAITAKVNANGKTLNELLMEIGSKMKQLRELKRVGVGAGETPAAAATTTTAAAAAGSTDNAGEWKEGDVPVTPLQNGLAAENLFEPEPETWAQMAERMGYLGNMRGGAKGERPGRSRRGRGKAPRKTRRVAK